MSIYEYPPFLYFCLTIAIVFGAVMGSFLNCAAWRIAHGESFLTGRSHCPACGHVLGPPELIPVLSWVIQGGRCKNCGEKISIRYPLTELGFACMTAACLLRFDVTPLCLRNYIFLCCLFVLSLVDMETYIIPDECHIIASAAWLLTLPFTWTGAADAGRHVLAALIFGGGILVISLIMDRILGRDSLGGGDIKLIAVAGLYLGITGTLFMIILACIAGLLFFLLRREDREQPAEEPTEENGKAFPFGPSLALASGFMLLFGDPVVAWYLGLLGL